MHSGIRHRGLRQASARLMAPTRMVSNPMELSPTGCQDDAEGPPRAMAHSADAVIGDDLAVDSWPLVMPSVEPVEPALATPRRAAGNEAEKLSQGTRCTKAATTAWPACRAAPMPKGRRLCAGAVADAAARTAGKGLCTGC